MISSLHETRRSVLRVFYNKICKEEENTEKQTNPDSNPSVTYAVNKKLSVKYTVF